MFEQFITSTPRHQNAVDLFQWVSQLPQTDLRSGTQNFDEDRRVEMLIDTFGGIKDFSILELGPLEAAHTYQLEQLGAGAILGIEASPEFYLKCLIAKEIFDLNAQFLLGDFNRYLEQQQRTFDLIFASGVLYHMSDPIHTLYLIAKASPRVFLWTHYIIEAGDFSPRQVTVHDFSCDYYEIDYDPNSHSRSWAGVNPSACRLQQDTIVKCLKNFGFDRIVICEDQPDHPGGPAMSLIGENTHWPQKTETTPDYQQQAHYYQHLSNRLRTHIEDTLTPRLLDLHSQKVQTEQQYQELLLEQAATAERYRIQLEQLQQQQHTILQSHSWRLTAPLRSCRRVMQRLFSGL